MLLFNNVVYMLVRYESPSGPMCLRCLVLTFSGPVELLFCFVLLPLVMLVVCSLSVFLSMCVSCLTVLVNCLLNVFTMCVGEVNIFCLKVIGLFLGCVGVFLLANPCLPKSMCVAFLILRCV